MNTSRASVVVSAIIGRIASVLGYILGVLSLIIIIFGLTDMESKGAVPGMILSFFIFAFSIFSVIKGSQIKRRIKRFKRYVSLISFQSMTSLANIAVSTSQSLDYVRNDLQKMIDKKFFAHAVINTATDEIIIGGLLSPAQIIPTASAHGSAGYELDEYTCPKCGATGTKVKGIQSSCDYCGSLVK